MDAWKVKIFISASMVYGRIGYLNLENHELLDFYGECLALAQYFEDLSTVGKLYLLLGLHYEKMKHFAEALKCFEGYLRSGEELGDNDIKEDAYKRLAKTYNNFGDYCFRLQKYKEAIEYSKKSLDIAVKQRIASEEGNAYGTLGNASMKLGEYHQAVEHYKKYPKIAKEAGNKLVERTIYWNLGCTLKKLSKYKEAITYLEQFLAMAIDMGDKKLVGMAYGNMTDPYEKLGKHDKVIEYSEKGLKIAKEIGNRLEEGIANLHLGVAYQSKGEFKEAKEHHEKALEFAREVRDVDYRKLESNALSGLGAAFKSLGKSEQAIRHYEESIRICGEIGYREGESNSFIGLGVVYGRLCMHEEALNCYEESLNIAKETGEKHIEGTAYLNMGCTCSALGKYYDANKHFKEALKIFNDVGFKEREGQVYRILGNFYKNLGMYAKSIKNHEESLRIAQEIGNQNTEGSAYGNLGAVYQKIDKFNEALESYEKCLKIAADIGDTCGESRTYCNIGSNFQVQGKYLDAIEYYEKSLELAVKIGDKKGEGQVCANFGGVYALLKKYDEAIKYCEKSLRIAEDVKDKSIEGKAYNNLGSAYHLMSNDEKLDEKRLKLAKEKSICSLEKALDCWEWLYDNLQDQDEFKISIVDTYVITYKLLTALLIETQQIEKALSVCDRGRARALGDLLFSKYNMNNEDASKRKDQEHTNMETVVLSDNVYIISYAFMINKGIVAWVLSKSKPLQFIECDNQALISQTKFVPQSEKCEEMDILTMLSKVITSAYCIITDPEEQNTSSLKDIDPFELLYTVLITPLLQNIKDLEKENAEIVIIPEGPLYKIPFPALRDPNTEHFLSETKRIRLAPSLTTLKTLQECSAESHCKIGALVVGDPDVGEVIFQGKKKVFPRLPSANQEAEIIKASLNAKPLIGSKATKENVKDKLREGVAIIHIAAHGSSENGNIVLAPPTRKDGNGIPEEKDYILTMQEVQEMKVKAQLVFLSCCESGRGEVRSEGVVGMSRAFLAAGARAVVASLWDIDDDATLNFMVSFYMYLKMGDSASKCLQKAMKDMREEGYVKTRHWAPFFLMGDDVTIKIC